MANALRGTDYVEDRPAGGPPPSKMAATPDFRFAWHPESWGVVEGRLVPRLKKIRAVPGALGSTHYDKKAPFRKPRNGWNIVPTKLTEDGRSYVRTFPCETGTLHLERWITPFAGSSRFSANPKGYAAWCEWLVAEGHIPPCPIYVIERLEEQHRNELAVLIEKAHGNSAMQPRIAAKTAIVELLAAKLEEAQEAAQLLTGEEYDDGSEHRQAISGSGGEEDGATPPSRRKRSRRAKDDA